MAAKSAKALEIFFCYAHEDEPLRHQIEMHVNALKRLGQISTWSDRNIRAGSKWTNEPLEHLNSADVILLLISPAFLASDDCHDIEMPRAIERHERGEALVIPILLRPVHWEGMPFAQITPLPSNGIPITQWRDRNEALLDVTLGISKSILAKILKDGSTLMAEQMRIVEIFYCYARKDRKLRDELERHLEPLRRTGKITTWYDREILGGTEWKLEIDVHLNTADIILLLASSHFMASDYCYRIEMQRALERHKAKEAHVIPIILSPVAWQTTPLGALQALPRDGKPITRWNNRDEAFLDVVSGIRAVIETLS